MGGAECETRETCDPRSCPNLSVLDCHVTKKGGEPRARRPGRAATASVALPASGFSVAELQEIQAGGQTCSGNRSPPLLARVAAPREISITEKKIGVQAPTHPWSWPFSWYFFSTPARSQLAHTHFLPPKVSVCFPAGKTKNDEEEKKKEGGRWQT